MDIHRARHLKLYVVSLILTVVKDDTMPNAGRETLGKDGDNGDDGGNGEIHGFWLLVVDICRLKRISGLV